MPEITLGGVTISSVTNQPRRLSMLLWGVPGCGKTTLAATAPGKKLFLSFDPDGTTSIGNAPEDEILVADFSSMKPIEVEKLSTNDNPLKLKEFIEENKVNTVVIDSMTSLENLALFRAVQLAGGQATNLKPTIGAYQYRNSLMLNIVRRLMRLTVETKTHIIFLAHENAPEKNEDGAVIQIGLMLGGKLPTIAPVDLSEVWVIRDDGKGKRHIAVRPCRMRAPMKTRMFSTSTSPEFEWRFDPDTWKGDGTIANWYNKWIDNGGKKIPLPNVSK